MYAQCMNNERGHGNVQRRKEHFRATKEKDKKRDDEVTGLHSVYKGDLLLPGVDIDPANPASRPLDLTDLLQDSRLATTSARTIARTPN